MTINTCSYVSASQLVPEEWRDWFWEMISDSAPFSWGDNSFSLISPETFADHCSDKLEEVLPGVSQDEIDAFVKKIRELRTTVAADIFIDLES